MVTSLALSLGERGSRPCYPYEKAPRSEGHVGMFSPYARRRWQYAAGCCHRDSSIQPLCLVGMLGHASSSLYIQSV